ncbi:hypothetical protein L2E82_01266 [Cichorium intybus]|uniref:Uncharacterized protein n=1 Tax=Cichorium intybus TaxID=13427 RepID=A0ACB9GY46_CICIN|nr:hypothetical protein L1887_04878 [Cichorium endivia]KAI3788498.1 hypothetical protein L2E82_01266 [Cichorium intybus]
MGLHLRSLEMLVLLISFLWWPRLGSPLSNPETKPARALDATLQEYAYRAFLHPRTGIPFDGLVPPYLTGIEISAMRLRSGSLYHRGVQTFKEFRIPMGIREQPYVERLVLVYQNLGNWSTTYYPIPGYTYLAPIVGLLAYNGSDLSSTNLPELDLWAADDAITVKFGKISSRPDGSKPKCVWFDLHGQVNFTEVESDNQCSTYEQGHFSIVVESPPPAPPEVPAPPEEPAPSSRKNMPKVCTLVAIAGGGTALLVLLALLIFCAWRYKKRKRIQQLERAANAGETLRMTRVGSMRVPYAMATRTMPDLELDFSA